MFDDIWSDGFGSVCSDESLVEESRTFETRLQSLLHDTIQESESSMEVRHSCGLLFFFSPSELCVLTVRFKKKHHHLLS